MFISNIKFILGLSVFLFIGLWWYNGITANPELYWADMALHFLGGILVAAIFLNFFGNRRDLFDLSVNRISGFLFVVSFVALIGLLWEFYEYLNDYFFLQWLSSLPANITLSDTLSDLLFDLFGGITASVSYYSRESL